MVSGQRHDHIAAVHWVDVANGETGENTREQMVEWLDASKSNKAVVGDYPTDFAYVGTVHPQYGHAYIRTYADGEWTDNLLAIDEY